MYVWSNSGEFSESVLMKCWPADSHSLIKGRVLKCQQCFRDSEHVWGATRASLLNRQQALMRTTLGYKCVACQQQKQYDGVKTSARLRTGIRIRKIPVVAMQQPGGGTKVKSLVSYWVNHNIFTWTATLNLSHTVSALSAHSNCKTDLHFGNKWC